ncbi:uncharacterized protein B0P05DRAFT_532799 [Gilbertella persicaria]|uniref:uncharacterized protein n=1 Tax=Gilbertella persicaria TaxID=101096 RepID=UPI00221FABDB|nr:uncharacterized protein B0P05DRAFT_532799 [Gilbertella persicaria]KAI8086895.1 hypothetical protein B0P05DRAFT_532799 [Gilbertella persicaria]
MSYRGNQDISHAEAALGAGRPYEKSNEGHNQMFDSMKELEAHHAKHTGHPPGKQSRGERIDQELAEEDKQTIEKKNQAHMQSEQAHAKPRHE